MISYVKRRNEYLTSVSVFKIDPSLLSSFVPRMPLAPAPETGDKTSARELAIKEGVPVVPGTDGPVTTIKQARDFIEGTGVG